MDATHDFALGSPYALFLAGQAWVWIAGLAWILRRRLPPTLTWAWLSWYGLSRGLIAGLGLFAGPHQPIALAGVQMALLLPGGVLAWRVWNRASPLARGGQRTALRLAAAMILVEACLGTLGLSRCALLEPLEATSALGALAAIGWYHRAQVSPTGLARRWVQPAAFVLLAALGWAIASGTRCPVAAGQSAQPADPDHGALLVAATGANTWDELASERLRTGLPVLGVLLLLAIGLGTAHHLQSRPAKRPYLPNKCSKTASSRPS